jgi:Flp pilus assembly protein protease CpaA
MLEMIFLIVAFVGSILAALFDLKTTEIPDEIPYTMMAFGIVGHAIESYLVWSYWPFFLSIIAGLSFLGFGFLMYFLGQWGGGDAKLLSAIGFLVPIIPPQIRTTLFFPFPVSFFFNLFLVGAVYMIFYALIMSLINRKIWSVFVQDLKANAKMILTFNFSLIFSIFLFGVVSIKYFDFFSPSDFVSFSSVMMFATVGLFFLWKFIKVVEDVGFKKRIPIISKLKVGDVPIDYKVWEGITEKELKKIRKSGKKYIWIKEGVRFAPAFPLALFFTVFYGDAVVWFVFRFI